MTINHLSRDTNPDTLWSVFPQGTMVISQTEAGAYLGRVTGIVVNQKGVAVIKIGPNDWASYADETHYANIYRALDCLAEENDNGYHAAYTYLSNWSK